MKEQPVRVGIICFPTLGGSGVVASELALLLAARGHQVHVFSSGAPGRLGEHRGRVVLHQVDPFFRPPLEHGAYSLALASSIADATATFGLTVLHAHYAVPHAAAAVLARDILARRPGAPRPRLVTTLHGTDAGHVGADRAIRTVTRHVAATSDLLTAPSAWLAREATRALELDPGRPIEVVPNFVDPAVFRPLPAEERRPALAGLFPDVDLDERPAVVVHASNFRPVKRVSELVAAFELVHRQRPALLVLVGDGPEHRQVMAEVEARGLSSRVGFVGPTVSLAPWLGLGDVFLLASRTESFGLACLEALSCGVPVVVPDVGGLPEVVRHGETGLLAPDTGPAALAEATLTLLDDEPRRRAMARAARADVMARFQAGPVVDRWEALYRGSP